MPIASDTTMPAHSAMDPKTVRRIGWALGLSLAFHVGLVLLIQAQPGGSPSLAGSWTVHARIEHQAVTGVDASSAATTVSPEPVKPEATKAVGVPDPGPDAKPARDVASVEPKAGNSLQRDLPKDSSPARGIDMPFVRDPNYYAVAALDSPPRLLGAADACYPQGAIGEVAYVLLINEQGTVDQVTVNSVKPEGLFTGAAVDLCSRLRFTPAIKDGRPVRSRVRFVVGSRPS